MIRYRALQNQRTRIALSQAAMKRAHRRCDLIRTSADQISEAPLSSIVEEGQGEQRELCPTASSLV